MDSFVPLTFDISEIYRQYCEILSGRDVIGDEGHMFDDKSHKSRSLNELLKLVNEKSISILEEIHKMMLRLNLMVDFSEFSRFYDFVFFMCRESGQKNITINKAVMAWRLVLSGRFRLLDEWCDFVEKNHRHNISEDTWRQVLAFSRCVHENLEGYDPEGAWPVLIDDFVEHMYRIRGSNNICCDCGDSEGLSFDESLPGLKMFSGLKRKFSGALLKEDSDYNKVMNFRKRQINSSAKIVNNQKNSNGSLKSSCSVEGCLSKGFAGVRV